MTLSEPARPLSAWGMAELAAALIALDGAAFGGLRLRCPAGPVREAWLGLLSGWIGERPLLRMPAAIGDARLLGGLDLAATLSHGRPMAERGLLAQADGGILVAAMAERLSAGTAARLAMVLDGGRLQAARDGVGPGEASRFGVVALDEGLGEDERPPEALTDRLALWLDLTTLSHRDVAPACFEPHDIAAARLWVAQVEIAEGTIEAVCTACYALGIASARAPLLAVKVARAIAALLGRAVVADEDVALAAALVLAPRATQVPTDEAERREPQEPQEPPPPEERDGDMPPPDAQTDGADAADDLGERVLEAAKAAIPAGLLTQLLAAGGQVRARQAGRAGQFQKAAQRGRIVGSRPGDLRGHARLDVVETLRQAAPWQIVRRREARQAGRVASSAVIVRRDDFRVARYRQRSETATLFVVDASGSAALQRLAEAKGAVRLLLAECYVRRDEVALIAFRKTQAEIILPPTRSLVRAERALAALPGGGGTPLATAIDAAAALADAVRRKGRTPALVFMTDGRANIGRDGGPGRARAQDEAQAAGRSLRAQGFATLLIDTSAQRHPDAAALAVAMGARYLPLPYADAGRIGQAVTAALAAG